MKSLSRFFIFAAFFQLTVATRVSAAATLLKFAIGQFPAGREKKVPTCRRLAAWLSAKLKHPDAAAAAMSWPLPGNARRPVLS